MRDAMLKQPIINTLFKNRADKVPILACIFLSSPSTRAKLNALLTAKAAQHIFMYIQIMGNTFYRPALLVQVQELFFGWELWLLFLFIPARCSNHFSRFVRDIILFQPIGNSLRSGFKHISDFLIRAVFLMEPLYKLFTCWLSVPLRNQSSTRKTHFHSIGAKPTSTSLFAHSIQLADLTGSQMLRFIQFLKSFALRNLYDFRHLTLPFCAHCNTKDRYKSSTTVLG